MRYLRTYICIDLKLNTQLEYYMAIAIIQEFSNILTYRQQSNKSHRLLSYFPRLQAKMEVEDLFVDLADGIKLLKLLEIISGEKLGKPNNGRMRVHKIENVNKSLAFLHTKVSLRWGKSKLYGICWAINVTRCHLYMEWF